MKKLIILLLLAIIGGVFYYYYNTQLGQDSNDLWTYVPSHSIVVYESNDVVSTYNEVFFETEVGTTLFDISAFSEFDKSVQSLDTAGNKSGTISTLLKGKLLTSLHVTDKNSLGIILYKELNEIEQKREFSRLIDFYSKKEGYFLSTRKYQSKLIYELANIESKSTLSYILENNVLIASFTSFLVEDVIRLFSDKGQRFIDENKKLSTLPKLSNDAGNVYINMKKIEDALRVFKKSVGGSELLKNLGTGSFFDINIDNKGIYLNGFTEFDKSDFLNVFKNQSPVSSNLRYFIPNNAAFSLRFSFSNSTEVFNEMEVYISKHNPSFEKMRNEFKEKYALDWRVQKAWVNSTISVVQLSEDLGQLLYVGAHDINQALNQLNTFGEAVAAVEGDSVYVERYSTYEIREIEAVNYPKLVFMPFMDDFEESYYTAIDNFIVFGSTIQNLKMLIDNIEKENTWGRSVSFNTFLDRTLEESNLSFTVNTERFLQGSRSELEASWKDFVSENIESLNSFHLASVQFSRLDDNFYSSVVVEHQKKKEVVSENFSTSQQVLSQSPIITKPFVVKSHVSNLREVVLQDSSLVFELIGNDGSIVFSKPLESPIIGEVDQIDFYDNDKLQYFFATKEALHVIDRNGHYVDGYPKKVDQSIVHAKVIDYDNSKRYRFLTADDRGNIYLFDKNGNVLEGWNPKEMEGTFTSTPYHVRVRKKDCFVIALANGQISLLNRRGENLKGFPLDLEARLSSHVDVKIGSDLSNTIFTTITKDGSLVKFNMEGAILETKQLYKPTKESEFRIISDALGKSFVIVRKDLNRLVILNEQAKEVLAKDYFDAEGMIVQFYDFSASNKLFAVTDKVQGFTYLYNNDGKLINSRPVNSEHEVGVIYSEVRDDLKIYCTSGNSFKILQFK